MVPCDVDVETVGVEDGEVEDDGEDGDEGEGKDEDKDDGKDKEEGEGWRNEDKGGLGQEWQLFNSCP